MWALFAQTDLTGWVTAGTSIGLLGPVLYWLCYHHLPAKDTQIKELLVASDAKVAAKDDQIEKLLEAERKSRKEQGDEYKAALNSILAHCEKENTKLTEVFKNELQKVINAK